VPDTLAGLRQNRRLEPILPRLVSGGPGKEAGEIQVLMPGDPGYDNPG
jgi:hypothetical protein